MQSKRSKELRVRFWLLDAGFVGVSSREVVQQTYSTGAAHLDGVRAKGISVLTMMSEESFRVGISRLAAYVAKNPDDKWLLFDKLTLTVGRKRGSR